MSLPGANLQAILGQLLAAAQAPSSSQAANASPGIPADVTAIISALSILSPQLSSILRNQPPSNTADVENANPLSDSYRRAHMTFTPNERPKGTPGRGTFNLRTTMGLNKHDYDLFLRTVKDGVYAANLNRTEMLKAQDPDRVSRARAKIKRALPGLAAYANCHSPYWPVDAGLLVILKSLTDSHRRRMIQAAQEREQEYDPTPDGPHGDNNPPSADAAPVSAENDNDGNTSDDGHNNDNAHDDIAHDDVNEDSDNEDEGEEGNMTMASTHELDELHHMEMDAGQDSQEDEEMADDTPSPNPPAYNSTLPPTNPVLNSSLAPVTVDKLKSRKSSPNVPAPAVVAPAPAKKRAQSVVPTASNLVAPTNPAAARSNRSRCDNKAEAVSNSVSIAPSSNVTSTSAVAAPATTTISYASTTNTTVQAQASSTTGLSLEPGNTAHSAWLPASKRPSLPSVSGPGPNEPPAPVTKSKRDTRAKPQANSDMPNPPANLVQHQPTPKPKRKTKAALAKEAAMAKEAEPVSDAEPTGLSDMEPAPLPKPARKKRTPAANQPAKKKAVPKSK